MVEKETIVRRLTFLEEYCSDLDEARQNINWEIFSQDKVVRIGMCQEQQMKRITHDELLILSC